MAEFVGGKIRGAIDWNTSEIERYLNSYLHGWVEAVIKDGSHYMYLPFEAVGEPYEGVRYDGCEKKISDPLTIRFSTDLCSDLDGIKFDQSLTASKGKYI